MELEAGCVEWSIRRLRRYLFSVFFHVYTDHECLQQISKICETKPRIQGWVEFLSAYNFRLTYRRGRDNANADFLSRLPLPPIEEDITGYSALTDPKISVSTSSVHAATLHQLVLYQALVWMDYPSPLPTFGTLELCPPSRAYTLVPERTLLTQQFLSSPSPLLTTPYDPQPVAKHVVRRSQALVAPSPDPTTVQLPVIDSPRPSLRLLLGFTRRFYRGQII